jgi:hypothetical protein
MRSMVEGARGVETDFHASAPSTIRSCLRARMVPLPRFARQGEDHASPGGMRHVISLGSVPRGNASAQKQCETK